MGATISRHLAIFDNVIPEIPVNRNRKTRAEQLDRQFKLNGNLANMLDLKLTYSLIDSYPDLALKETARILNQNKMFDSICSEVVTNFLYVSGVHIANDLPRLKRLSIYHYISCCREVRLEKSDNHLELHLHDDVQEDLTPFFHSVVQFIAQAKQRSQKVLIYCHRGISRSCALAIAYLMYSQEMSFVEASAYMKEKRAISNPNGAFVCQLLEWEQELKVIRHASQDKNVFLYRLSPHAAHDTTEFLLKTCFHRGTRNKVTLENSRSLQNRVVDPGGSRGVYTIFNISKRTIYIFFTSQCIVQDPEGITKCLYRPMLWSFYGDQSTSVRFLRLSDNSSECSEVYSAYKHLFIDTLYSYEKELQWVNSPRAFALPSVREEALQMSEGRLYIFIEQQSWEEGCIENWEAHLEYDIQDLCSSTAALLLYRDSCFLWIGRSCDIREPDMKIFARQLYSKGSIQLEQQGKESSLFWEAFESGY